jgi:RHS repeat-associated protein
MRGVFSVRRLRSHPVCRLVSAVLAVLLSVGTVVGNVSVALAEEAPVAVAQAASTEPTVTVVRELTAKRTETSKHYLLSNGLQRAEIFAAPVHFKDSTGTWRDIDTELLATAPGEYRTAAASVTAEFEAQDGASKPVTFGTDEWTVALDLAGSTERSPLVAGDTAVFDSVKPETNLVYESCPDGIKETVVLSGPDAPASFTFDVALDGVKLCQEPGGGYVLVSEGTGKIVSRLGSLVVFDSSANGADGAPAFCDETTTTVTLSAGTARITYSISSEWLAAPERVFPVRVDPTFTSSYDTYVSSAQPDTSFGTDTYLHVGHTPSYGYQRSYMFFDTTSLQQSDIYAANLRLFLSQKGGSNVNVNVAKVTSAWDESTTWNTKPNYSYLTYFAANTAGAYYSPSITATVKDWATTPSSNFGIGLYEPENSGYYNTYWRYFAASEASNANYRPKLVVDYNSLPGDVTGLNTLSTSTGLQWWRSSSATAANDLPKAGRAAISLSWNRPARAVGYHVWMFDGSDYRQVADIADPRCTTWSSEAAQLFAPDSAINSWGDDGRTTDPFYRSAAPGDATHVSSRTVSTLANTGVTTTDGTYLYARPFYADGAWSRIGNGIESTVSAASQVGGSVKGGRTGFYLDGYLYSSYAFDPYTIKGIWKNASSDTTATKTLTFSRPLLYWNTGKDLTGATGSVLLATDGERIYNVATKATGGQSFEAYRIRVYDRDGTWIEDKEVPMPSNVCDSVFTDGDALYLMQWSGAGADETTIDKVSLDTWKPVNRWKITQVSGSAISGVYDSANDCFFLGTYEDNDIHRFSGPGLDLRDNPVALYRKTPGDTYDNTMNYIFRVTAYNEDGEPNKYNCTAYNSIQPNRSVTAVDDPRHTTEEVGSFADHSMSAVLDKSRLQVEVSDLSVASFGPDATLSRTYRSDDTSSHGFSKGWRFSFDQSVETSGTSLKTWVDEAGERHTFSWDASAAVWIAPPGMAASLTVDASNQTVETKDHTKYAFDLTTGRLTSVTDRQGDAVTYNLAGNNIEIQAANGHSITVTRDASANVLAASDGTRSISYVASGTASVTWFPGRAEQRRVEYDYTGDRLTGIAVPNYPTAGTRSAYTVVYDGSGKLTGAVQPVAGANNSTSVTYAGASASVITTGEVWATPRQITKAFTWNPNGTTATRTEPKVATETAATWSYTYAPNNEQILEVSPTQATKTRVVDASGNLLTEYDEAGHRTSYAYNASGDCIRETGPRGCTTYRSVDVSGNVTREERELTSDGTRAVTTWTYPTGGHGLPCAENRRASSTETYTTEYAYDVSGAVATETVKAAKLSTATAQDLVTVKTFDAFGNVTAEYDATGSLVASSTYDLAGRVTASEDASGVVTNHVFDALGNDIESWRSHTDTATKADWTKRSFDGLGHVITETRLLHGPGYPDTGTTQTVLTHTYDAMGRETVTDDTVVAGQPARSYYDARGNVVRSWAEGVPAYDDARATRTDYDIYGRQVTTYEPESATVASTFTYYPDGQVKRETRADGTWTDYAYDDGDNKISETSPDGGGGTAVATFTYDVGGRLVAETDADGALTSHTYDLLGRETGAKGEGPASSVTYNAAGNVISKTDADGVVTETVYDASGRVVTEKVVSSAGTRTTTTSYDTTGKTLSSSDPDSRQLVFEYDVFGRTSRESHTTTAGVVKDESTLYDSLGRPTSTADNRTGVSRTFVYPAGSPGSTQVGTTYAGVSTTVTVGADGREATRVSNMLGVPLTRTSMTTDTAGRETGWRITQGTSNTDYGRTYTSGGQLGGWSGGAISGTLSYDTAARKARDQLSGGLLSNVDRTFSYTDEGRLSGAKPSAGTTSTISFDAAGNLTTETVSATTTVMHYDTTTQRLLNRSVGASVVATYTFDAFGQRIAQGPTGNPTAERFTYTGTGRLASYASSSASATYAYDASGQRTRSVLTEASKTTTTTYTYEGLNLLSLSAVRSDGATWSVAYLYDGQSRAYAGVYSTAATTTPFQLVTTDRGDVVELLDGSGARFASYRYDDWGAPSSMTTATTSAVPSATVVTDIATRQPLRYAGYCYDEHSKLYYLSARSYDPLTRQFISKDPAKADGEESAYQYCGGEPVGKVDPSGLRPRMSWWIICSPEKSGDYRVKGTQYHWFARAVWSLAVGPYSSMRGVPVTTRYVFQVTRKSGPGVAQDARVRKYVDKGYAGYWRTMKRVDNVKESIYLSGQTTYMYYVCRKVRFQVRTGPTWSTGPVWWTANLGVRRDDWFGRGYSSRA